MNVNKEILLFLESNSLDGTSVDKILISSFLEFNEIEVTNNSFIKDLLVKNDDLYLKNKLNKFIALLGKNLEKYSFEVLINLFEFVISPADKTVNGAVYTPKSIREFIGGNCLQDLQNDSKIGDLSCGCGGFLYDYSILLRRKFNKSFYEIYNDNIYGIDITKYSITRTKIILSLLAISEGEDVEEFSFNLYEGNSLEFDWFAENEEILNNNGFDYIVGNPPYVGANNIDEYSRKLLPNWKTTTTGKADLYIPFFEIGYKWLKVNGVLGYITVSSFMKSLNGRALRNYFLENKIDLRLIDFGGEQIFKGRRTYTCIAFLKKSQGNISYIKSSKEELFDILDVSYTNVSYDELLKDESWTFGNREFVSKIEKTGNKLGDIVNIKNGFATLRNKIYLFNPYDEKGRYYFFEKKGIQYKVEKEICRDAIKPNILKTPSDIQNFKEKIIFPYTYSELGEVIVLKDSEFKRLYPFAYKYLNGFKKELAERDRGNKTYEEWFSYGRSQALNVKGLRLLFPYISDKPHFIFSEEEDLLFYNGFAVLSDSKEDLLLLQKILYSDVFWKYVTFKSRHYENGYFSLAKNYIKNFGIPELNKAEKKKIINFKRQSSVDSFLLEKYDLI